MQTQLSLFEGGISFYIEQHNPILGDKKVINPMTSKPALVFIGQQDFQYPTFDKEESEPRQSAVTAVNLEYLKMLHLFDFNQWGDPMVDELNILDLDPRELGLKEDVEEVGIPINFYPTQEEYLKHKDDPIEKKITTEDIMIQLKAAYEEIMQSIEDVNRYTLHTADDWYYYYLGNCNIHNLIPIDYQQFKQTFNTK